MMAKISSAGRAFSQAWAWWVGEIRDAIPRRLRGRFDARRGQLVVRPTASGLAASVELMGRSVAVGVIADRPTLNRQLAQTREWLGWRQLTVVLRPDPDQTLMGNIGLPTAAKDNLREVVGFEMDRFTPFRAEDVYHDCQIIGRSGQGDRIEVAVAVVPRRIVDDAVDRLAAIGLDLDAVEISPTGAMGVEGLNLLPAAMRPRPWRIHKWITGVLLVVTIALAAASVVIPLERATTLADELARAAVKQRKLAQEADELQKKIDALDLERKIAAGADRQRPTVTTIMDEVARALPDDAWLFRLRWDGQQIELSGFSRDSTSLASLIEASPLLANVAFAAPVVIDPAVGRERFILTAKIEAMPAPAAEASAP